MYEERKRERENVSNIYLYIDEIGKRKHFLFIMHVQKQLMSLAQCMCVRASVWGCVRFNVCMLYIAYTRIHLKSVWQVSKSKQINNKLTFNIIERFDIALISHILPCMV